MVEEEIRTIVRRLFMAENSRNVQIADEILAEDYVPIIRANGQADSDRQNTLDRVETPKNPNLVRDVDRADIDVRLFLDDTVAIARTILPTTQPEKEVVKFHNTQVFLRRNDRWQCVAWQVTKIEES